MTRTKKVGFFGGRCSCWVDEADDDIRDSVQSNSHHLSDPNVLLLHLRSSNFGDFVGEDVFEDVVSGGSCALVPSTAGGVHRVDPISADETESPVVCAWAASVAGFRGVEEG